MKKFVFVIILSFSIVFSSYADNKIVELFPDISELPGGKDHWVSSILPPDKNNGCTVYSATYAYFAEAAQPLFDIPRSNVYSVNIRFHVCENMDKASALYDKFSQVGEKSRKQLVGMGDKGILYVVPSPKSDLMGDYYLTGLFRYIVMQIHADDGFVLMDMNSLMSSRLQEYLSHGRSGFSNSVTAHITKSGYEKGSDLITFSGSGISKVNIKGILYDQNNNRVPKAKIYIVETGDTTITNDKGEYEVNVGSGKGKELSVFRILTVNKDESDTSVKSGYYAVDIEYKQSGNIGQDIWRLDVNENGKIIGTTFNIKDSNTLTIIGNVEGDNLTIERPCGKTLIGVCLQNFKASLKNEIFEGEWSGTGGGGVWKLYKNSYEQKPIVVSMKEAGYGVKGTSNKSAWSIVAGAKPTVLTLTPDEPKHTDFNLVSAKIVGDMEAKADTLKKEPIEARLGLYGNKGGTKKLIAFTPLLSISKTPVNFSLNITDNYKFSSYDTYTIEFYEGTNDIEASITKLNMEIMFAVQKPKTAAAGAINAKIITFNGEDIASNTKVVKANGSPDIVIELNLSAYGGILSEVEVQSKGKESRKWSTALGNIYPGVAVVVHGKTVNKSNGTVNYTVENIEETVKLYIDKGSLKENDVKSFKVILKIDDTNIEYEIKR